MVKHNMTNPYCTIDDVKNLSRVTPNKLGLEKTEIEKLDNILTDWILEASALIDDYTENPLSTVDAEQHSTKYYVYKNLSTRIVANMCALSAAYKSHSVVKVNDWTIKTVPSEIFPVVMKEELDNYKATTSGTSTRFGILTVTGEGVFK